MSENRPRQQNDNSPNSQIHGQNMHEHQVIQDNQPEQAQYHVVLCNQSNGSPENASATSTGRAYTIVQLGQLGQHFNLQLENQPNHGANIQYNNGNNDKLGFENQSMICKSSFKHSKLGNINHIQTNHNANTTGEELHNQSVKSRFQNSYNRLDRRSTNQLTSNQNIGSTTIFLNQSVGTSSMHQGNQSVKLNAQYTGTSSPSAAAINIGNWILNSSSQYPGNQSSYVTTYENQSVNTSQQHSTSQSKYPTTQSTSKQTVNSFRETKAETTVLYSGNQTVGTSILFPGKQTSTSAQYIVNQSHTAVSKFLEDQSIDDGYSQQYKEQNPEIEKEDEESQSLLCSETFTSPTPPSDDCGWTQTKTSVIWTHCENSNQGTAFTTLGNSFNNAVRSHGPLSDEQFHSQIGKSDKGELLKAALLGETHQSDTKLDTEYLKRDINSNFQSKCADEKLKFGGNDVDSGWRMSGSNGYDRNRMTGSSSGGTNNNLSLLSDGSSTQSHTQPQVATAEGMLLGRIGSTGGVALHDIGSRSIVAGTAGAGPQVTLASVFRPPQSVPEAGRYGTAFTTAAGSSAVGGPYSPLYAAGSHGAGIGPYSAFYNQYPSYNTGVMHGTLDPQYGSYSAVLQSMGSHAAQSQVPRSPYGGSAGTGASGVLGQYSLHMPRTTSPGGKTFIANTNISTHERDDSKYRREVEVDKRRYSTGIIKDEKPHQFPVPSGFPEPNRVSFSSTLRESPSQGRDPQDYYKVPSGREGSLKHRILRPSDSTSSVPLGNPQHSAFTNTDEPFAKRTKSENLGLDKDFHRQGLHMPESSQSSAEMSQGRTPPLHYPPHFMKGSIIQLGNGEYKRVEDLETDDFRHSADVSSDLKIDSSTVVHIEENKAQGTAVLGFVVGEHKIQVTVEATVEHPFFVFGQGWSSCEPNWTLKRYGLECHKLSVGDVCISLTHKEVTAHAAEISQQQKQQKLEDTYVFEKDIQQSESVQQIQRESPSQGQGHRNRSPANSQSPTIQGQSYRSESGQYNESSTASAKGERLFSSTVSSQIPSSSQTQEQRSLPSTTS